MNTFGSRLKDARRRAKLTQPVVVKRVGMSQALLSELENDKYPTSGFTTKLAHLYKVNARWLAEGLGPREVSAAEALGDDEVMDLWTRYNVADDATRALVQYLLGDKKDRRAEWMSSALAAMIDNAKQLTEEQMKTAPK